MAVRRRAGTTLVYAAALLISTLALLIAALRLLDGGASPGELLLPVGLPWVGAHLRLDALAAFFLVVVNLGGATASLYGLGYGRHEEAPGAGHRGLQACRQQPRCGRAHKRVRRCVLNVSNWNCKCCISSRSNWRQIWRSSGEAVASCSDL